MEGSTPFAFIAESDFVDDPEEDEPEVPEEKMNEILFPLLSLTGDLAPSIE
jgi:hypothetical protein